MDRYALNVARVASLLLFIVFSAMWVWSHLIRVQLLEFSGRDGRRWEVVSGKGLLSLGNEPQIRLEDEQTRVARHHWMAERRRLLVAEDAVREELQWARRNERAYWRRRLAAAEAARSRLGATLPNLRVTAFAEHSVHYVVPVAVTAVLPAAWLWAWREDRRRADVRLLHGFCVQCGYDLRGNRNTGFCPECGAGRGTGR